MSTQAAEPMPLILDNASIKISRDGTPAGLTELACLANHVELSPDVSATTLNTFCGSRNYPGTVQWSLVATLYQSFDPDATEEVLSQAVALGAATPFQVQGYRDRPTSVLNPVWSGMVIPQPYPPINGDAGDASTVDLEWSLTGAPVKSTTAPAGAAAPLEEKDYAAMTVAELQAEAAARNLATTGTKAELVERLTGEGSE